VHSGIRPNPASRRREAVGKLVGEHDDVEGNSIRGGGEKVLSGEELSMAIGFGQRGMVTVARCDGQGDWLPAREASRG
jgi:hypothetical protein